MAISRCRVCFTDTEGLDHAFEVEAASLYKAVAFAMAQFRDDNMLEELPKLMTEFTVTVIKEPVQHKIRLQQVHRWAQPSVIGGPAAILKREKVRLQLRIFRDVFPLSYTFSLG